MVAGKNRWVWSVESPLKDEVDGGIVRFFKAEGIKQPGVLAIGAPPDATTLFAREAVQNSWDAGREWHSICADDKKSIPPFWIEMVFSEVVGKEKISLVSSLGLSEHDSHIGTSGERVENRSRVGLFPEDCLDDLSDPNKPLRILKMIEHSSLGMPGNFMESESRMMFALVRVGYTMKKAGAGGSYGYGKAGLISSSRVRVIYAYSCFKSAPNDAGVTRRLMGATYWSHHKYAQNNFTGWARFGAKNGESAEPFINEEADSIAESIGISIRDPKDLDQMGTTFMVVDPTIDASELKAAIERNWWPAMMDDSNGLRIRITDYDGTVLTPEVPKNNPHLQPFVRAYELACRPADAKGETEKAISIGEYRPQGSNSSYALGTVGLVADPNGWSFPSTDESEVEGNKTIDHCSLVALVRGPKMIVEYHRFDLGMPYIRGCFIADQGVDDLLRQTEPKAHDKWDDRISEAGIHKDAPKIAWAVYSKLREQVKLFKQNFAPPPPRPGEMNLPILDELSRLMKGKKPPVIDPEPRTMNIRFTEGAHSIVGRGGTLSCKASIECEVAEWVWEVMKEVKSVTVTVQLAVAVIEDQSAGERLDLEVKSPRKSFVLKSNDRNRYVFEGTMEEGDVAKFEVLSKPYSPDWSVKFTPSAEITFPTIKKPKKSEGN